MMRAVDKIVLSEHGLLTTVAYKLGPNKPAVYAMEGSVAVAGTIILINDHEFTALGYYSYLIISRLN